MSLLRRKIAMVAGWTAFVLLAAFAHAEDYPSPLAAIRTAFLDAIAKTNRETQAPVDPAKTPTTGGPPQAVTPARDSDRSERLLEEAVESAAEELAAETDAAADEAPADQPVTEKPRETNAENAGAEAPNADAEPEPEPLEPLSPALTELRNQVRRSLRPHYAHTFSTQSNTPIEIMAHASAFGGKTEVYSARHRQKMPALGLICFGYASGDKEMLRVSGDRVIAAVGHGAQTAPGELLATLARCRVSPSYEITVGKFKGTVGDLIESEMQRLRKDDDNAYRLIGLSYYLSDDPIWQNDAGETWSLPRLVAAEVARKADNGSPATAIRLTALAYAVRLREKREQEMTAEYATAAKYLDRCRDFVYQLQNSDGSFHPHYFANRGTSRDTTGVMQATGHIAEFLVTWNTGERLEDPRLIRTLDYLAGMLAASQYARSTPGMPTRDILATRHACRALMLYDRKVFAPHDAKETAEVAKKEDAKKR